MKNNLKAFVREILMGLSLLLLVTGCAYLEKPYTYHEFDGLFVYYKTQDVARYRELLPSVFEMPAEKLQLAQEESKARKAVSSISMPEQGQNDPPALFGIGLKLKELLLG